MATDPDLDLSVAVMPRQVAEALGREDLGIRGPPARSLLPLAGVLPARNARVWVLVEARARLVVYRVLQNRIKHFLI